MYIERLVIDSSECVGSTYLAICGLIQTRGHGLHRIELSADPPNHKVGTGAQAYSRITVDQE